MILSGWWFGCHQFYFPIDWECHHPNWRTPIFQRGEKNHPPVIISYYIYSSQPLLLSWLFLLTNSYFSEGWPWPTHQLFIGWLGVPVTLGPQAVRLKLIDFMKSVGWPGRGARRGLGERNGNTMRNDVYIYNFIYNNMYLWHIIILIIITMYMCTWWLIPRIVSGL